jgi:thiamine-phosphate pyrophosphorylase
MSGLPRLMLIADGFASGRESQSAEDVQRRTIEAVRAGVRWVQLRDLAADEKAFASGATRLAALLREVTPEVRLSVNTHAAVAARLAAGFHVGHRGPSVAEAVRLAPAGPVSAAVHSVEEAVAAAASGAEALLFSPVFPTTSKPGAAPAGSEALREVCAAVPGTRVLALGGVTSERVKICLASGARGVAVLSGILDARDPAGAAEVYLLTILGGER